MQQRGFAGTTVEDVAAHLDLTKAAFYYYVPNKEELLYEIAAQTLAEASETLEAIDRSGAEPPVKLERIVDAFVRLVAARRAFFTVYFEEKGHLSREHLRSVTRTERRIVDIVERILREGMSRRLFRRADPTVAAFGILGMCFWTYQWYRPGGRLPLDEISAQFQRAATHGWRYTN